MGSRYAAVNRVVSEVDLGQPFLPPPAFNCRLPSSEKPSFDLPLPHIELRPDQTEADERH